MTCCHRVAPRFPILRHWLATAHTSQASSAIKKAIGRPMEVGRQGSAAIRLGLALIDEALVALLANEQDILSVLIAEGRDQLAGLLAKLLRYLSDPG